MSDAPQECVAVIVLAETIIPRAVIDGNVLLHFPRAIIPGAIIPRNYYRIVSFHLDRIITRTHYYMETFYSSFAP